MPGINMSVNLILKVLAACLCSFGVGLVIVDRLRALCHVTNEVWKLASICYVLPVAVYVILNIAVSYELCEKLVADSVSFGILTGICLRLLRKPSGEDTVRVLVRTNTPNKAPCVVWLKSPETKVSEAIIAIGNKLSVIPHSRISVETGRGAFVTDVDKPLLQQLSISGHPSHNTPNKDFFGFTTAVCNVVVREEEREEEDSEEEEETTEKRVGKRPTNLTNLINSRGPVRWKDDLLLSANVGGVDIPFSIGSMDNYAAAAPPPAGYSLDSLWGSASKEVIHFVPWTFDENDDGSEIHSDASLAKDSSRHSVSSWGSGWFKSKGAGPHLHLSSAPVHDGDTIVIVSSKGKFMSVRQGWWMAWGEAEPRRSGAFIVEIVERAPQLFTDLAKNLPSMPGLPTAIASPFSPSLKLALNAHNLAHRGAAEETKYNNRAVSSGDGTALNTGDLFRLRSVKFPEYELGITSKKIGGDHCYLGLHKAQAFGVVEDENVWCHTTRFSARYSNTIVF